MESCFQEWHVPVNQMSGDSSKPIDFHIGDHLPDTTKRLVAHSATALLKLTSCVAFRFCSSLAVTSFLAHQVWLLRQSA